MMEWREAGSVETCARVHAVSKKFLGNSTVRLNFVSDFLMRNQTGVQSQNVFCKLAKPKKGKVN